LVKYKQTKLAATGKHNDMMPSLRLFAAPAFLLLYAVFAAMPLAAQYRGVSLGLGGEVNAVNLDEYRGYGAVLAIESRLNRYFGLSFQGNATVQDKSTWDDIQNGTAFMEMEAALYLRFYFLSPGEMRRGGAEVFIGAGGGVMAAMNGNDSRNSRGSPEAGGIFGIRFRLGSHLYLEPYIRASYPFTGGAGIAAGVRFPARVPPSPPVVEPEVVTETGPSLRDTFVFVFESNIARFYGLDDATIFQNKETLLKILKVLKENPDARLLIEGYANPVLGTVTEEWQMLRPLSEKRAVYIAGALISCGISPERLVKVGEGGSRPVAVMEDRENWRQNRRVEIRFLQ
jgi:outer membrane protein OmpA-like peptidoglycan-associated protein